jgi:predicted ATPase/class 3 adenylate cyclase
VTCSNCGAANPEGSRFCLQCGTSLAVACANGAATLPGDARFCNACGTPIGAGAGAVALTPADAAAPPSAERRLVSVLFADLVGFTSFAESRDPEEVRDLLSRYFETCRKLVERYGGTVEKFIGDAVMAVWGTPVANEDDAERAVRAALDLVEAVSALGQEVGSEQLRARAGVLTGEAAVDLAARGQGMVAGDLVNTASRIQAVAPPGAVYAGEATRRATEAAVAYEDAGLHEVKGKAEPLHLHRALRVVAGRGGLMKSEGLESPFVGRERELKIVKDLFHTAVEEHKAQLVQVVGIAGIGKSRLAWEFFKYLDGLQQLFLWHRGRSLAYGEGVTYWALAEMVRGRAGIVENEDRATALQKLRRTVEQYVPDADDCRFIEPRLAHLVGLEERSAADKADLFAGWRLFLERLAESAPVVMVFEDMQWADPSLVEFVDHVMAWSRNHPVFVMALTRPDQSRAGLLGSTRNTTTLSLEPLPAGAMDALLTGLVPGLPPELATKILERAEGVPLYAMETVRMLLDRGLLVQEGPVYQPAGRVDSLEVPETLHALIAARLDGLTQGERRLVQDAAVLGKTFTRAALAALSDLHERDLEPLLAALVAKEVLTVQADPRSPERGQYGFLQDLVRTVAYDTLARKDRKERHLRVAAYLERAWGEDEEEEIVEVVASHYLEAYRLAPEAEGATEIRAKARRMLVRAAERAASLAAAQEAQRYFERAAELTDSPQDRAELSERAGQMAVIRGSLEDAVSRYEEAGRIFGEAGETHAAARVEARLAEVDFLRNRLDQAIARTRTAYEVLSKDEPDADLAMVAGQLGRFLAVVGSHGEAIPKLEEALTLAELLELPEIYAQALSSRGVALITIGRFDEAETMQRRSLQVALDQGLTLAAVRGYNNLSSVLEARERFDDMLVVLDEAIAFARRTGARSLELALLTASVSVLVELGRWDEALERAREAEAAEELASLEWAASGLMAVVPLHIRRGDQEAAVRVLESMGKLADSSNREIRCIYIAIRSEWLLSQGKASEALAEASEALSEKDTLGLSHVGVKRGLVVAVESALALGDASKAEELLGVVERARPGEVSPYLRGNAARLAARVAALQGLPDASVEPGFAAAEREFRERGVPWELGLALLDHAEWLAETERPVEASEMAAQALAVFEQLGARPWIERASRLVRAQTSAGAPASV